MSWRSSGERYGWGAQVLHWTTAVLTIGLLVSGFVMRRVLPAPTRQVADPVDLQSRLYSLHALVGLGVAVVIAIRLVILWRDTRPTPPVLAPTRVRLFRWVHRLQYLAVVGLAGSGGGLVLQAYNAGTFRSPDREGRFIATLAFWDFKVVREALPGASHRPLGWIFAGLLIAHLAGVVEHQRATGDPFRRMLWRRES